MVKTCFPFKEMPCNAQTHHNNRKPTLMKASWCITSRRLCLCQKTALEHSTRLQSAPQCQPKTFGALSWIWFGAPLPPLHSHLCLTIIDKNVNAVMDYKLLSPWAEMHKDPQTHTHTHTHTHPLFVWKWVQMGEGKIRNLLNVIFSILVHF